MNANRKGTRPRRGFTLPEVAIAAFVLVVAMGLSVKVLGWLGTERRAADRRQWAIQATSNVMERIVSEPFDRVTVETARALADKAEASRALPGADWEIAIEDDRDAPVPGRRISLRLRWKERSAEPVAPVRLTSWVYRQGASK